MLIALWRTNFLALRRAYIHAHAATRAVVGRHLNRERVAPAAPCPSMFRQKPPGARSTASGNTFIRNRGVQDRPTHKAAVDANRRIPNRNLRGDAPFFNLRRAGRKRAVDRHRIHRQRNRRGRPRDRRVTRFTKSDSFATTGGRSDFVLVTVFPSAFTATLACSVDLSEAASRLGYFYQFFYGEEFRGSAGPRPRASRIHMGTEPDRVRFASIGPVTSSTLRALGLPVDIEAGEYSIPGLIKAIVRCEQ